jgi:hypothetical protein
VIPATNNLQRELANLVLSLDLFPDKDITSDVRLPKRVALGQNMR